MIRFERTWSLLIAHYLVNERSKFHNLQLTSLEDNDFNVDVPDLIYRLIRHQQLTKIITDAITGRFI